MSETGVRKGGRLAAYAAFGFACLWTLLSLLTWTGLQNGVRVSSPLTTHDYGQAALFSAPVHLVHIVGPLIWCGLAAFLGYILVIRPIWGGKGLASAPWMVFAGVIPGVLMLAAVTRVVTLLAPNQSAAWIVVSLAVAASVYCVYELRRSSYAGPTMVSIPVWRSLAVAAAALVGSLIFQLHIDRGHVVAEGSIWFINEIFLSPAFGVGADGYFPRLPQHYDEAAFLHPLVYLTVSPGPGASASLTLIYWIMLASCRLGMIALTYIALRGLSLDRLSALLCTAFVCMASLSLNPVSSQLLFDSLNPMLYTLHMARFLAPVLPLLIISAALQGTPRWTLKSLGVALLLGLGLSSAPVHIITIGVWAAAVFGLCAFTKNTTEPLWRMGALVAALVLFMVSATYLLQDASAPIRAGFLAIGSVVGGLLMIWGAVSGGLALPDRGSQEVRSLGALSLMLAAYGIGLLLLGNVTPISLEPWLSNIWPWSERGFVVRLDSSLVSPELGLKASTFCKTGYYWGFRNVVSHCGSMAVFVRTYGFPFALIAAVLAWRAMRSEASVAPRFRSQEGLFVWSLVLCLLALPMSFLIFDFITPISGEERFRWTIWLRSRLAEPWFVGGALLALAYFLRTAGAQARTWAHTAMLVAISIHALNPLIAPAQWAANVAYWVDMGLLQW